jgi:S1-C subfamily serine protease
MFMIDLTSEQRAEIERNTGVMVDIVLEDSSAFNSNVLAGDIVISVDGKNIRNVKHSHEILKYSGNSDYSILKVIRKGEEREIKVVF